MVPPPQDPAESDAGPQAMMQYFRRTLSEIYYSAKSTLA